MRFEALNGLRGMAALWVALGHTIWALQQMGELSLIFGYILKMSWVAVEVFFMISGFVMAHAYPHGISTLKGYGHFMLRRFARVYPLYILCLLAYIVLVGAAEWGTSPTWLDYVKYFTLTQVWFNYSHHVWLDPAWSLSAEWGSYVLAFLMFPLMKTKQKEALEWLTVLTIGFIIFHLTFAQNNLQMIVQCGVFRAAPCFAIGILLYRLRKDVNSLHPWQEITAVAGFLALYACYIQMGTVFCFCLSVLR